MGSLETLIHPESPPPVLYHYETVKGLMHIIDRQALLAPDIRFVNENAELAYMAGIVLEETRRRFEERDAADAGRNSEAETRLELFLNEIVDRLSANQRYHLFACLLDQEGDGFACGQPSGPDSKRFSLGFDTKQLLRLAAPLGFKLVKCIFDAAKQQKILRDRIAAAERQLSSYLMEAPEFRLHLNNIADDFLLDCIQLSALFKHPSFHQGGQWCLFCMPPMIQSTDTFLQFHEIRGMIAPCMEIKLTAAKDHPFPMTRLIVGPTPHLELSADSVELLLASKGIHSCRVEGSMVPYQRF